MKVWPESVLYYQYIIYPLYTPIETDEIYRGLPFPFVSLHTDPLPGILVQPHVKAMPSCGAPGVTSHIPINPLACLATPLLRFAAIVMKMSY